MVVGVLSSRPCGLATQSQVPSELMITSGWRSSLGRKTVGRPVRPELRVLRVPPRAMRSTSVSGSAKVPSGRGTAVGSTLDRDLGGGADADARGAGVAASPFSLRRSSASFLPLSFLASSSSVGGGCCGGGGIAGAAAFGGLSPLGVEGLGGLGGGVKPTAGGLLGGGNGGLLLGLLGLRLSGTAALALALDAFGSGPAATGSETDALSVLAFGGFTGSGGGGDAAVERQGAAPTEDDTVACEEGWSDLVLPDDLLI